MTANSLILRATHPPHTLSWQRLMMWINLDWRSGMRHLRGLRQWSVSAMLLATPLPTEELLKVFIVEGRSEVAQEACMPLTIRVASELTKADAAGRTLTRVTMPIECWKPRRRFRVGAQTVRVQWVDRTKTVAAWATVEPASP